MWKERGKIGRERETNERTITVWNDMSQYSLHGHFTVIGRTLRTEKRQTFRRALEDEYPSSEDAEVTFWGRLFQARVTATGNARSSTMKTRVRQTITISDDDAADRRHWRNFWVRRQRDRRVPDIQTFVCKDGQLQVNPLCSSRAVELTQQRSDKFVSWRL